MPKHQGLACMIDGIRGVRSLTWQEEGGGGVGFVGMN